VTQKLFAQNILLKKYSGFWSSPKNNRFTPADPISPKRFTVIVRYFWRSVNRNVVHFTDT